MRACIASLALLTSLATACTHAGPADPAPFLHALAMPGCTQEDIPAVEILLTKSPWNGEPPVPTPHVRIEVAGVAAGARAEIPLSGIRRDPSQRVLARAGFHADDKSETWLSGTLQVYREGRTLPVQGSYTFCGEDRKCFQGSFNAPWRQRAARCG